MATAFAAGQAAAERAVRSVPSTSAASQRLRVHQLAFAPATRSIVFGGRTPELRAQRAAVQALPRQGGPPAFSADGFEQSYEEEDDSFQERVVQVRRVTKVVKGGKQLSFRAVVSWRMRLWSIALFCFTG